MHRGQFHSSPLDVYDSFRSHVHPTKKVTARLYRSGQRASLTVTTAQDCTRNPGRVLTQLPETDQYQASTCRKRMRPCRRNGRSGEPDGGLLGRHLEITFQKYAMNFQLFIRRPNCRVSGESEEEVELDHPNEGSLPTTGQRGASEYTEPNPASRIALHYAICDEQYEEPVATI